MAFCVSCSKEDASASALIRLSQASVLVDLLHGLPDEQLQSCGCVGVLHGLAKTLVAQ